MSTYYNQIPTLQEQLKDLDQRMRTTETAPRLASSAIGSGGLTVNDGGSISIRDGGYLEIIDGGTLSVAGNTSIGGTLTVGAASTFSGSMTITGDLTLNDGSIKGNALENQISASNVRAIGTGWAAISNNWTVAANVTASRPSWATQAMIIAIGTATGMTNGGGEGTDSALRIRMNVNGSVSSEIEAFLSLRGSGAEFQATGTVGWSNLINNPGTTVYASIEVASYRNVWWPANPASNANVSMQVLWLR